MVFYLIGGVITWAFQKKKYVALSSWKAEFTAATLAVCQGIWLHRLLNAISGDNYGPVTIYVNNGSAIELIRNHVFHV